MNKVMSKLGPLMGIAEQFSKTALDAKAPAAKWIRRAGTLLGVVAPIPGPGKFIASFAAGTAVGIVAGLALAPASGAMNRRRLASILSKAAAANPTAKRITDQLFGEAKSDRDPDGPGDAAAAEESHETRAANSEEHQAPERNHHKKRNGHTRATA